MTKKMLAGVVLCLVLITVCLCACTGKFGGGGMSDISNSGQEETTMSAEDIVARLERMFPEGSNEPTVLWSDAERCSLVSSENETSLTKAQQYYRTLTTGNEDAVEKFEDGLYQVSWTEGDVDYFVQCSEEDSGVVISLEYSSVGERAS